MHPGNGPCAFTFTKSASTSSTTRRTDMRHSTSPCREVVAARPSFGRSRRLDRWTRATLASSLALVVVGCADPRGNDPNVPDQEPDGVAQNSVSGPACLPALPQACGQAPSYAADIAPLVERTCVPCHGPGGVAFNQDFTTYKN